MLAPVGKDAALIATALRQDAPSCVACRDLEHLALEVERGAAAIVIAEEALAGHNGRLARLLAGQPSWSDLPVLLLTRAGCRFPIAAQTLKTLGNVTLLERPVRVAALVSAVRSALRARARQFEARAPPRRARGGRRAQEPVPRDARARAAQSARADPELAERPALRARRSPRCPAYEIMDRQVNHMVRLIDDLLDVSRITRGKIELRKGSVDLADVIAAAVETSRPLIDAAKHDARRLRSRRKHSVSMLTRCVSRRCSPTCSTMPPSTPIPAAASNRGAARAGQRGRHRQRYRRRHPGRVAVAGVRHVRAGRRARSPLAVRARHRSRARAEPGRDARRKHRGDERRRRQGEHVRRAPSARWPRRSRRGRRRRGSAADEGTCRAS